MRPSDPSESPAAVRRSPYGANPALGRHGSRARLEILAAARGLFAERGYHSATVEAIGEASGRSGASVYQYFEGKGQIFRVLIDELSADVLAEARRLGSAHALRAGPGGAGEREERISALSEVLGRHSTTFALWSVAEEAEPALRGCAAQFLEAFAAELRPGLEAAGIPADRAGALAIGLGSMVQWSHFTRCARTPELGRDRLDHTLARVVGLALSSSPDLPAATGTTGTGTTGTTAPVAGPVRPRRPAAASRAEQPGAVPGVRRQITARSQGTLDRIVAAAACVFRRNGFHGTSINDIATEAGVSHGSVYTYWPDRSGVFTTLAHSAAVAVGDHLEGDGFTTAAEGRAWLERWLDVVDRHGPVLHIWTHEVVDDEQLGPLAREVREYFEGWLDVLLRAAPTAGALDEAAAHLVLWALLTDFPYTRWMQLGVLSREQVLDVLSTLLLRGLLGYR